MSPRAAFWRWAFLGALISSLLLIGQASAVGGIEGMLQVGETSRLRPIIEAELGAIQLADGPGHDGQIYYAIALDLDGNEVAPLLDHGAYRYRRIAYPLLASMFGLLGGEGLIFGMIGVTLVSTSVAAGATASIARLQQRSDWWTLAVVLNPGVWLSVQLLTGDTTAIALMVVGLLAFVTRSRWSHGAFAASVLAKEVYLVTPGGLALGKNRTRWLLAGIPLVVLIAWMTWLTVVIGDGFAPRGNLDWPLKGIVEGMSNWGSPDAEQWFYLLFALGSVAVGLLSGVLRQSWLRWPILGWSVLGLISSNWVWDFGNNAARAFAPIAVLVALSYVPAVEVRRSDPSVDGATAG